MMVCMRATHSDMLRAFEKRAAHIGPGYSSCHFMLALARASGSLSGSLGVEKAVIDIS
jgi:hypothetical protein